MRQLAFLRAFVERSRQRVVAAVRQYPLLISNLVKFTALNVVLQLIPVISRFTAALFFRVPVQWSSSDAIALVALSWIAIPGFIGRFEWTEQRRSRYMLFAYGVGLMLLVAAVVGREMSGLVDQLVQANGHLASQPDVVSRLYALREYSADVIGPLMFFLALLSMYAFFVKAHIGVLLRVNIRLRWHHQAQFAGIYVAKDKGIFEKNGLDVRIHEKNPLKRLINAIGSGTNEFGIAMAPEVVRFRSEGRGLVAVEILSLYPPLELLADGRKIEGKIKNKQPIRILTVEYYIEDEIIGNVLLKKHNIGDTKIETSYYSDNQGAADFLDGSYDAIVVHRANEKLFLQRQKNPAKWDSLEILNPLEFGLALLGETLVTTQRLAEDRPKVVEAMKRSVIAGWEKAVLDERGAARSSLRYRCRSKFAPKVTDPWQEEFSHQKAMLSEMNWMFGKGKDCRSRQTEAIWKKVIRSCVEAGIVRQGRVRPEQILGLCVPDLGSGFRSSPRPSG